MKKPHKPEQPLAFGDVVAAVFEEAQRLTTDPTRAAALAAAALRRILAQNGDVRLMRELAGVH